jgi:Transmembrane secretion effector
VAGVLIAAIGSGWVFLINAASFAAVLFSLCLLQSAHVQVKPKGLRTTNGVIDGFRYVAKRSDLKTILFMAIALGTTPIGAPIVGWIADHFGARWALGAGAASGLAAAIVGIYYLMCAEDAFPPLEKCRTENVGFSREAEPHDGLAPQARMRVKIKGRCDESR